MAARQFMTDAHAKIVLEFGSAGKPYRPANGMEGELFEAAWCADCRRRDEPCPIWGAMLFYGKDEPEYPKEVIYGDDGHPKCLGHAAP